MDDFFKKCEKCGGAFFLQPIISDHEECKAPKHCPFCGADEQWLVDLDNVDDEMQPDTSAVPQPGFYEN